MPRWKRKPRVPKGLRDWPEDKVNLSTYNVVSMYTQGYSGAKYDEEARETLYNLLPEPDGEQVAYDYGLAGSGEGKLSLPYLPAYKHWPKSWPCPGQTTGDCVSHAGKNSALVLIGVECELGQPDQVTGNVEDWPVVTPQAEQQGVVACEPIYGYRGHTGQGANCERLIAYTCSVGGIMLRQNYPDLNLDLTNYNASIGIRWGGSGPPANVNAEGKKHQIRTATDAPQHEVCRDFIANGYPIWACSGLGWSSSRDQYGYSRQSGSWSHSWIAMGYDDRPKTVQKYGFPLFLYNHDWGNWNGGGRDIMDSQDLVPPLLKMEWINLGLVNATTGNLMIPNGAFWADARLLNKCDCTAMSNMNGWPPRQLDYMLL